MRPGGSGRRGGPSSRATRFCGGTTQGFLDQFQLESLSDLPAERELRSTGLLDSRAALAVVSERAAREEAAARAQGEGDEAEGEEGVEEGDEGLGAASGAMGAAPQAVGAGEAEDELAAELEEEAGGRAPG